MKGWCAVGGAARRLAHIGVLEWLEEHRIPVDANRQEFRGVRTGYVGTGYLYRVGPQCRI